MSIRVVLKCLQKDFLLTGKNVIDKKYERILKIRDRFEMEMIKRQNDLYLKCVVLLLADVFQKFRNFSLKKYELYPSHYLSAPGLSWDAIVNITKA